VTGDGLVHAVGAGTMVVRAKRGDASASGRVTVAGLAGSGGLQLIDAGLDAPPADPLGLSHEQARSLRAVGVFADADLPDHDLSECVAWTSSDESVVVVGPDGRVTAVGDPFQTATVTVTYDDGMSTTLQQDVEILIGGDALTGLTVSGPAGGGLVQGATADLAAIASFAGGKPDADVTDAVDWSSSPASVATVSNEPETAGRVTGIEPGSAQLEAELGGFTDSFSIEVIAAPAAPARLTASAEPNAVLSGLEDPATICARLVPNSPATQLAAPFDIEFTITEGPADASLTNGPDSADTVTESTGSNGEPACVALESGSDTGTVTVHALEPDSGLDETVDIEIVTSFSSMFGTSASNIVPAIQDGSAQSGTVFDATFVNGSNRAFNADPEQVTFCNGGNVINVQQKTPAAGDRVGGGGELDVSVELTGSQPDNGFAIAAELSDDEVAGTAFTLVHHFTDPAVPCPPAS
jgi:hypothetical protein